MLKGEERNRRIEMLVPKRKNRAKIKIRRELKVENHPVALVVVQALEADHHQALVPVAQVVHPLEAVEVLAQILAAVPRPPLHLHRPHHQLLRERGDLLRSMIKQRKKVLDLGEEVQPLNQKRFILAG